jgi:thioredoxin 1
MKLIDLACCAYCLRAQISGSDCAASKTDTHKFTRTSKEKNVGNNTTNVTDSTFDSEVIKSKVPVLVDFWAEWCAPCRALAPTLEEVAGQFKDKIKLVKINIDDNPETPTQFGVRSIPTLILFKDGKQVDQSLGNIPRDQVVSLIQKAL